MPEASEVDHHGVPAAVCCPGVGGPNQHPMSSSLGVARKLAARTDGR